jgi:hypothetical protein
MKEVKEMASETQQRDTDATFKVTMEVCSTAQHCSYIGLSREEIAAHFGLSLNTLNDICKQYKQLDAAIKKGEADGLLHVSKALFDAALKGDTDAQIFYLSKWRENH